MCDAECFTGSANELANRGFASCTNAPPGEVTSAGPEKWADDLLSSAADLQVCQEDFMGDPCIQAMLNLSWVVLVPINICFWGLCCKGMLCPAGQQEKSKRIFYLLTTVVLICGIISAAAAGVVLNFKEVIEGYMSVGAVYVVLAAGASLALFAGMGIYAVRKGHRCLMITYLVIGLILLLIFVTAAALFAKYAQDVDGLSRSSLAQAGDSHGVFKGGGVQEDIYAQMESFACNTYQTCCEPTELFDLKERNEAPRQCKVQKEGMPEDTAFILSDPSHPQFCSQIAGVQSSQSSSQGVCKLIEFAAGGGFTLAQCQQDYCQEGLEGYENFIAISVSIYRQNMLIAGIIAACVVFFIVVQLMNLYYIIRQFRSDQVLQSSDKDDSTVLPAAGR